MLMLGEGKWLMLAKKDSQSTPRSLSSADHEVLIIGDLR